ncbi:MAG: RluA family pseudouridine synthase [Candidatus Blackburnbacteria bacterium]|nr:RluA family pseudouridine synthase [Candidatus Blackburnbacteria bacterium]
MQFQILYEDEDVLAVDKPSGMVVNRAESVKGKTVEDWAEKELKIKNEKLKIDDGSDFYKRSGVVHRLDKETSGILLIAKTPEAFKELQRQFKAREVEKTYIALVHGKVVPPKGVIRAPVGRLPWHRERFGVLAGGREAETRYKTISNFAPSPKRLWRVGDKTQISNEELTLLELYPKTGRTHQIRVHLKSISHPVIGDPLYAGRKTARRDRQWCPRLFLHAKEIVFGHPRTGKPVSVATELPQDLGETIRKLTTDN